MENFSYTSGDAASAASLIMPSLPDASLPGVPEENRLVLFLASAAQSEGFLSAEAWKKASEVFSEVFSSEERFSDEGGRSYDDRYFLLQTKFHAALLQPSVRAENFEGDEALAREFFSLPSKKAERYASAIDDLCPAYAEVLKKLSARKEQNRHGGKPWKDLPDREEKEDKFQAVVMEGGVARPRVYRRHIMPLPWKKPLRSLSSTVSRAERFCGSMASAAAEQYEHAADYMRSIPVWKSLSLFPPEQEMRIDAKFLRESEIAEELEGAFSAIGSRELMAEVEDIRRLMREQPFTLVVVGEGKRGKSSLINALLGGEFSPVRESVPETSAVACFSWGKKFHGRIQFFSHEECRHISEHFSEEFGYGRTERMEKLQNSLPPHSDTIITSPDELQKFLSSVGSSSTFAAKALVELPCPLLENGLVIVDTPGLNASDPVENYLAVRECMAADCLLFVLDARRPDSASEQQLLHMLASSGRAASIIGVLTGMDLLNEDSSRKKALDRARMLLDRSRDFGMEVLQLFEINAREAMRERCRKPHRSGGKDFQNLYACIKNAAASKSGMTYQEQRQRVHERTKQLLSNIRQEMERYKKDETAKLPGIFHDELLEAHVSRLESVLKNCSERAWSLVNAVSVDIEAWRKEQGRALDAWQETLVLRIMDAAGRHADMLGYPGMFKPGNWKQFDEETVPDLAKKLLEELLASRRDVQRDWNKKIRQFSEEMEQISLLCIDAAILDDGIASLGDIPFTRERWLVRANSLVKKAGLFAAGFALRRGTGVGLGIVLGNMGWWAVLPVAVAGSLVWTLMKFGSPSRCRRIFMERREEAVRHWAAEQRKRLEEILDQNLQDVTSAYGKVTQEGVMPALSVLAEEISSLRLYMAVLTNIRAGTDERVGKVLQLADRAESILQTSY